MTKHSFQYSEIIDYSLLDNRDSIYLDMNIWIDISDQKSSLAQNVRNLLRKLVADGKIFCPLHFPLLNELNKLASDSMMTLAELMNELSLNFSYAVDFTIWGKEVGSFFNSILSGSDPKLKLTDLYTPFIGHLETDLSFDLPDDIGKQDLHFYLEQLKSKVKKTTLPKFVAWSIEDDVLIPEGQSDKLNAEWKLAYRYAKGNRQKIKTANQEFVISHFFLPGLRNYLGSLDSSQLARVEQYSSSLPKDSTGMAFAPIIKKMPALRNFWELVSYAPLDNQRNFTMNDLYDIEHIVIPLAYSAALASQDKWMNHLVKMTKLEGINGCSYIPKLKDLHAYLTDNY